jgi:hypothetical protein
MNRYDTGTPTHRTSSSSILNILDNFTVGDIPTLEYDTLSYRKSFGGGGSMHPNSFLKSGGTTQVDYSDITQVDDEEDVEDDDDEDDVEDDDDDDEVFS